MFSKKRDEKPKRNHSGKNLAQYGLFDVPTDLSFDGTEDGPEDESDLEAELLALTSDPKASKRQKARAKPSVPAVELDAMIASSLRDIPSDEELSGDDDPDLMDELAQLTQGEAPALEEAKSEDSGTDIVKLLRERLKIYELAEANAKKASETSRARRFNRGTKTLKDLLKAATAGRAINPEDIPPEVSVNIPTKAPIPEPAPEDPPASVPEESPADELPAPEEPAPRRKAPPIPLNPQADPPDPVFLPTSTPLIDSTPEPDQQLLNLLSERKIQYKIAALHAKKSNDITTAVAFMKIAKQFDTVLHAVQNGEPVDLSKMPGPPGEGPAPQEPQKEENEAQTHSETVAEDVEAEEEQLITAGSIGEALQQRFDVYKKQEENAKAEGNSGKARRMGRIVKQYEQAIKSNAAGKPIPVDDLPCPPGYAPLLINPPAAPPAAPADSKPANPPQSTQPQIPPQVPPRSLPRQNSSRKMGNHTSNSHLERQVALLLARQREFKEAALAAKRKGEIAQAKELLKTAKGFDNVIEAARGGFPVDMESLPIPASSRSMLDDSFEVVLAEECTEADADTLELLTRFDEQLTKQLKMCLSTRDHHKALGDVAGVNRFENLALSVTKDLDVVRLAFRTNTAIPTFHYENRSFAIVKCCTDLTDNDVELAIIRGINYNCANPKDVDTYVRFEFPYPQEDPYKERTGTVKDSNNPEYNSTYTIPIQRTSRQCLRIFKRQAIKLEVYSKGGFFRSDQLLGAVSVKLQPLETQCELHDSFDLMDGRKKVGGKLEIHLRVRHPLISRQVEQLNERWLVLDH